MNAERLPVVKYPFGAIFFFTAERPALEYVILNFTFLLVVLTEQFQLIYTARKDSWTLQVVSFVIVRSRP